MGLGVGQQRLFQQPKDKRISASSRLPTCGISCQISRCGISCQIETAMWMNFESCPRCSVRLSVLSKTCWKEAYDSSVLGLSLVSRSVRPQHGGRVGRGARFSRLLLMTG